MASDITGEVPAGEELRLLTRRSGGIPLLVEELLAAGDSGVHVHLRALSCIALASLARRPPRSSRRRGSTCLPRCRTRLGAGTRFCAGRAGTAERAGSFARAAVLAEQRLRLEVYGPPNDRLARMLNAFGDTVAVTYHPIQWGRFTRLRGS